VPSRKKKGCGRIKGPGPGKPGRYNNGKVLENQKKRGKKKKKYEMISVS